VRPRSYRLPGADQCAAAEEGWKCKGEDFSYDELDLQDGL